VVGVSPRRVLDADYRSFLDLAAEHIGSAIAEARVFEEERRRAEALAELDRAKTAFFSNVSHEFRTPLTLMLGPLEELLAKAEPELPNGGRELAGVAHRNGLRLLRLVNTLLDFSRIEAGRAEAAYEPTDLALLTAELASSFRSACERAGLRLEVECPSLRQPVYVDRDMWEKIVLNLLSNAFKFTLEGEIRVSLTDRSESAELLVADTGVGIDRAELPRLFERFHRIEGQRSRSHEGSGIGLALVQELVRLHGGRRSRSRFRSARPICRPTGSAPPVRSRARTAPRPSSKRRCDGCRTGTQKARPSRARASPWPSRPVRARPRISWSPTTIRTCGTTWSACSRARVGT
jgi:signal transduction histidine kinase